MQIQLKQLVESTSAMQQFTAQPLPATIRYQIAKLGKAIQSELENYDAAVKPLVDRYGSWRIEGMSYEIAPENRAAFKAETDLLQGLTVDLPFEPIPHSALGEKAEISPATLMALDWLITEG